jgi:uncharacterized protein YndB with AHSA1/START domain
VEREVTITRIFDAPRTLVFDAWTDARHLSRWWGPASFTNPLCESDPRPGGAWRIVMRSPQGEDLNVEGIYLEFVAPEKLVSSSSVRDANGVLLLEGTTTVTFSELPRQRTELTLTARANSAAPFAAQMLEGMETGWNESFDSLAEELRLLSEEGTRDPAPIAGRPT